MRFLSRILIGLVVAGSGLWLARARRHDLRRFAVNQFLEKPTNGRRYAELADELHVSGERAALRLERLKDGVAAREAARHVIGIERWGQRRLLVALGEPFERDEHHPYKPPRDAALPELVSTFRETRAGTVDLARRLSDSPPSEGTRVEHNSLGPLSPRAWLRYLQTHADLETRRAR
ncbi:hypothetical protein [Deinococcus pimensis]|uniref:hypothetical protein n=1 Tax=Deinococcus pimensis TaxID=309888 RepID=UPI0004801649|nr:hypothetical protein [Deinococcus pimensis]